MGYVRALLVLTFATVASAQTYVVDASNGPGTNFLDLPVAIASVPDGAVLLVRPGTYSGFSVVAKGMTVLADPGVTVAGVTSISATAATQSVTLRGLTWNLNTYARVNQLYVADCFGPVLLEDCSLPRHLVCHPVHCLLGMLACFQAERCRQLAMRGCTMLGAVMLVDSTVVIDGCTIEAEDYTWNTGLPLKPALALSGGATTLAGGSTIRGGAGCCSGSPAWVAPGSGIVVSTTAANDLRLLSGTVSAGQYGGGYYYWGWALLNATGARVSPRVTLRDYQGIVTGSDVMPELAGQGAPPGGTLAATVRTESGDLVILAVGLPGAPTTLPGFRDAFWLDQAVHVFAAIGVQQLAVPVTAQVTVPTSPTFLGIRLHWQAACTGPVTGLQATNPVVTLVR